MTVEQILKSELILVNDNTEIYIRYPDMHVLARGHWYNDNILEYQKYTVKSFVWQDNNEFFIDLKRLI